MNTANFFDNDLPIDPHKVMKSIEALDFYGMVPAKIYAMVKAASDHARVFPKECELWLRKEDNGYSIEIRYRYTNEIQR